MTVPDARLSETGNALVSAIGKPFGMNAYRGMVRWIGSDGYGEWTIELRAKSSRKKAWATGSGSEGWVVAR